MDSHVDPQQQQLHDALDQFEASVEAPFVPGEMERWIAEVESAWSRIVPILSELLSVRHPEQCAEIRQEDQELVRRVEQVRQEDQAIAHLAAGMRQSVSAVKSAISSVEPDEAQLKPILDAFVSDALNFVIRVRKQGQAVRTWFQEAFTRDRGTVD